MNTDENIQAYDFIEKFYRQLVGPRGHFSKQTILVRAVAAMAGLSNTAHILDAACGTGDVIGSLYEAGFVNIAGLDGSLAMVSQFNGASGLPIACVRWEQIDDYFAANGTYDMIFLLGNSLAHHPVHLIPKLLHDLYAGLNQGGVLLLDLRHWERDAKGRLFQPGRSVSEHKDLGEVEILGNTYRAEDIASYDEQKQTIKYRLRQVGPHSSESRLREVSVSYFLFDEGRLRDMLLEAGFRDEAVETQSLPDWFYRIVIVKK